MTQEEAVSHWQKRARAELKAARALFEKNDPDLYGEVLFHCHLTLELSLKASFIERKNIAAPFTHDLNELADSLREERTQDERDALDEITDFAILSRYGDEEWHAAKATKEKADEWLKKTEQLLSTYLQS